MKEREITMVKEIDSAMWALLSLQAIAPVFIIEALAWLTADPQKWTGPCFFFLIGYECFWIGYV